MHRHRATKRAFRWIVPGNARPCPVVDSRLRENGERSGGNDGRRGENGGRGGFRTGVSGHPCLARRGKVGGWTYILCRGETKGEFREREGLPQRAYTGQLPQ